MTYSTSAIVLRRRDHGEWDRIYTVYTRERGKLTLIGKGTRRPKAKLAAHLEPYAEVDLVIANGKAIDRITFARTIETSHTFVASWERVQLAAFVCECVDVLTKEHHRDPAIYDLLRNALSVIARSSLQSDSGQASGDVAVSPVQVANSSLFTHHSSLITPFTIRLLTFLGYAPQLDHCVECRTTLPNGPAIGVPLRGGLTCTRCTVSGSDGISLSEEDRQQLADAVASFRPSTVNSAVATYARVALDALLWQPLRTVPPLPELTRERDQVRIAAS